MNWMPEEPVTVTYNVVLTEKPDGNHVFYIQLFDEKSGEVVEIGLKENLRDNKGYYKITEVNF
jgi:hypothetical protein